MQEKTGEFNELTEDDEDFVSLVIVGETDVGYAGVEGAVDARERDTV